MAQGELEKKIELNWLSAFYGGLLTPKQRDVMRMPCEEDLSLGEIAQVMGVSRQAVNDNLARTEALLRKMEDSIGCVGRDLKNRNALRTILDAAERLKTYPDETVSALAGEIIEAAQDFEE